MQIKGCIYHKYIKICNYVYVLVCGHVHLSAGASERQESDLLELELQTLQVLGRKVVFSVRAEQCVLLAAEPRSQSQKIQF